MYRYLSNDRDLSVYRNKYMFVTYVVDILPIGYVICSICTYFYLWLCRDYDMYVISSVCIDFYLWSCRDYDMYVICSICKYFYLCLC